MSFINKIKNKSINYLNRIDGALAKEYFQPAKDDVSVKVKYSKPFTNTSTADLPLPAVEAFERYNQIEQSEYVYESPEGYYIEPVNGWILDKDLKNYSIYSAPYSELLPALSFKYIKFNKFKVVKYDKVISLQYYFPNYWHFFNDVLGQLAYLADIAPDVPIIVPPNALQIPFVKAVIASSDKLRSRTWIERESKTLIQANTIITAKNLPNTRQNFLGILEQFGFNIPATPSTINRKLFIKRSVARGRYLSNSQELEAIAQAAGFEIIDNDELSFAEQLALYQQARIVVGIHGAGLTNILFRVGSPLHLVELFPLNVIPPHYYWLCHELGFEYSCLVGSSEQDKGFYIEPALFSEAIAKLA